MSSGGRLRQTCTARRSARAAGGRCGRSGRHRPRPELRRCQMVVVQIAQHAAPAARVRSRAGWRSPASGRHRGCRYNRRCRARAAASPRRCGSRCTQERPSSMISPIGRPHPGEVEFARRVEAAVPGRHRLAQHPVAADDAGLAARSSVRDRPRPDDRPRRRSGRRRSGRPHRRGREGAHLLVEDLDSAAAARPRARGRPRPAAVRADWRRAMLVICLPAAAAPIGARSGAGRVAAREGYGRDNAIAPGREEATDCTTADPCSRMPAAWPGDWRACCAPARRAQRRLRLNPALDSGPNLPASRGRRAAAGEVKIMSRLASSSSCSPPSHPQSRSCRRGRAPAGPAGGADRRRAVAGPVERHRAAGRWAGSADGLPGGWRPDPAA